MYIQTYIHIVLGNQFNTHFNDPHSNSFCHCRCRECVSRRASRDRRQSTSKRSRHPKGDNTSHFRSRRKLTSNSGSTLINPVLKLIYAETMQNITKQRDEQSNLDRRPLLKPLESTASSKRNSESSATRLSLYGEITKLTLHNISKKKEQKNFLMRRIPQESFSISDPSCNANRTRE